MWDRTWGKEFLTDLNVESELLMNCVAGLYYHDQSKDQVRPVEIAMAESNTAPSKPI